MRATIRAAALGDEGVLAALNGIVHALHLANRPEYFKPARADDVSAWFRSLLETSAARIWLAEADGVPVGYIVVVFHQREANPFRRARPWCEIDQIAVDATRRRRGVARALVQTVFAEARRRGIEDVELSTWSFNETAQQVFRRLGFTPEVIRFGLTLTGSANPSPTPR